MSGESSEQPPLVSGDEILEQYADGVAECTFLNGVLHLSFWTLRADGASEPARYCRKITARLVLPIAGAMELGERIGKMVTRLESQGTIQRPTKLHIMGGPETRQ
jgi:hypothetical protein